MWYLEIKAQISYASACLKGYSLSHTFQTPTRFKTENQEEIFAFKIICLIVDVEY